MAKSSRLPNLEEFEERLKARRDAVSGSRNAAGDLIARLKAELDSVRETARRSSTLGMVDILIDTVESVAGTMEEMARAHEKLIDDISDDLGECAAGISQLNRDVDDLSRSIEGLTGALEGASGAIASEVATGSQRTILALQNEIRQANSQQQKITIPDMSPRLDTVQSELTTLRLSVERLANSGTPRLLNLTVTDRDEDGNIESVEIQATEVMH